MLLFSTSGHASLKPRGEQTSSLSFSIQASGETGIHIEVAGTLQDVIRRQIRTRVETGEFGASMQVALINEGPVTITIDSKSRE